MKIGILGSGIVARTLAAGFEQEGHSVQLGTSQPAKLAEWSATQPGVAVGSFAEAAAFGEVLVLAVKGSGASDVLRAAGAANLADKVVIDTTNPLADRPPTNGVLAYFTSLDESLMERLQAEFPAARLVKAFNCVGNAFMVHPVFAGGPPTMFICGNDAAAKQVVGTLLDQLGWETADMGQVEAARVIEPLCILWCIPGFLRNEWSVAFKLLRG
jgi:hypothetical protein